MPLGSIIPPPPFASATVPGVVSTTLQTFAGAKTFNDDVILSTAVLLLGQYATGSLPTAASYEGGIVYDSTTNEVKFSDGSSWTAMSGGGGGSISGSGASGEVTFWTGASAVSSDSGLTWDNTDKVLQSLGGLVVGAEVGGAVPASHMMQIAPPNPSQSPLAIIGGDGNIYFWKSVIGVLGTSIGQGPIGGPIGNDFVINTIDGFGFYTERLRIQNTGEIVTQENINLSGVGIILQAASLEGANLVISGQGSFTDILGLGKLITIDLPTADPANEGYIVYDSTTQTVKFSDGASWANIDSGGVTAMAAIGASPNGDGATISGSTLNLEPASASFGGVVTTGTQTLAGAKTFDSALTISAASGNVLVVNTNSLVVDATNNRVGVGTASPNEALDVNGNANITGNATFGDPNVYSAQAGITAFAGGGQASATQLTEEINFVATVATTNDSVKLPAAVLGMRIVVFNEDANKAHVYPESGAAIDGLGTDNPIDLNAGTSLEFFAQSSTQWRSR